VRLCPSLTPLSELISPLSPPELPAAKTTESYLGLLYAMEDYAVYVVLFVALPPLNHLS
jgi:hypothetical protein